MEPDSWTTACWRTYVRKVDVEWEWQRFGRFRGVVDGFVVAQVALVSDRAEAEPAWIVYLTGSSRALDERHATEFDAMLAAEAALNPGDVR